MEGRRVKLYNPRPECSEQDIDETLEALGEVGRAVGFFILGNALLDTSIAAWDAKRYTDSIRPITVIRFMFGDAKIKAWAGPGLGTQVIECKDFRSYLPTPPFGGYISGHSAFSASATAQLVLPPCLQ